MHLQTRVKNSDSGSQGGSTKQLEPEGSEVVRSQNLDDAPVRQNPKFAAGTTHILLKLKAQVKTRPMAAQLHPGKPAVVAGIQAKVSREVKVFEAEALLRDINQVRLSGSQFR